MTKSLVLLAAAVVTIIVAGCTKTTASDPKPESTPKTEMPVHTWAEASEVMKTSCSGCHGGGQRKGRLSLETVDDVMKGGESGPAVVVGDPAASLLVKHMKGEEKIMPPAGPLEDSKIAIIEGWIAGGAKAE